MIAGETCFEALRNGEAEAGQELTQYSDAISKSWVMEELKVVRNCKPAFKYGLIPGLLEEFCSVLCENYMAVGDGQFYQGFGGYWDFGFWDVSILVTVILERIWH